MPPQYMSHDNEHMLVQDPSHCPIQLLPHLLIHELPQAVEHVILHVNRQPSVQVFWQLSVHVLVQDQGQL